MYHITNNQVAHIEVLFGKYYVKNYYRTLARNVHGVDFYSLSETLRPDLVD